MAGLTEAGCLLDPAYDRRKSTVLALACLLASLRRSGYDQCCSLCEPDGGVEIQPSGRLWCAGAQRITAHLAFYAAWHLPTAAAHRALFEDLVQHCLMQGAPSPRGEARRTAAPCGGPPAPRARRRADPDPRPPSAPLRA